MEPVRDPEGNEIDYLTKFAAVPGRNVLEIGCGNGRLLWRYAGLGSAVTGIDPDHERLAEALSARPASTKTPVLFTQAEAQDLPFSDGRFESVILGWSL